MAEKPEATGKPSNVPEIQYIVFPLIDGEIHYAAHKGCKDLTDAQAYVETELREGKVDRFIVFEASFVKENVVKRDVTWSRKG